MGELRFLYPEDRIPEKKEDNLNNKGFNHQIDLNKQFYENLHKGFIDFNMFKYGKFIQDCYEEMRDAYKWDEPTKLYYYYSYLGEYIPKKGLNTWYSTAHYDFSEAKELQGTLMVLAQIIDHSEIEIKEAV